MPNSDKQEIQLGQGTVVICELFLNDSLIHKHSHLIPRIYTLNEAQSSDVKTFSARLFVSKHK